MKLARRLVWTMAWVSFALLFVLLGIPADVLFLISAGSTLVLIAVMYELRNKR